MLLEKFENTEIILGSKSPRRYDLLKKIGLEFKVITKEVDETYPENLLKEQISEHIVRLKSNAFKKLENKQLLITADTIVWHNGKALGKPKTEKDAYTTLNSLSDNTHDVITSVCLKTNKKQIVFSEITTVKFKKLNRSEIEFYIKNEPPFDKAGSYGIQDWIGAIGIEKINGCFFNVVGLPTRKLYEQLLMF